MGMQRFIVLPSFGLNSRRLAETASLRPPIERLRGRSPETGNRRDEDIHVLDTVDEQGPRLVEMTSAAELALRREEPTLKIIPVTHYQTMRLMHRILRDPAESVRAVVSTRLVIHVTDPQGIPVPGAQVLAFTNFRTRAGDQGTSDASGIVPLKIAAGTIVDRLYIYAPAGYWGYFSKSIALSNRDRFVLTPIFLGDPNLALSRYRQALSSDAGQGVVVGIVDTGIDRHHPALPNVTGGANMVIDETIDDPGLIDDWGPALTDGDHGTHVAGIVGARATGGAHRLNGIAPGVELRSYRVFPHGGGGATNYDIMKAIDRAVHDGCHIINLSLGGGGEDEAVRAAIGSAMDRGVIVIAAAGNGGRKPVSFPAALSACVAVSAMGWKDSFPASSTEAGDIVKPFGKQDPLRFVAGFSNIGPQIDLTGPGVGMVSTLPSGRYGAMSGTSMACPAVAGFAAYLLASSPTILNATGSERSRLFLSLLQARAVSQGFGRDYEGFGLPG